eukprot:s3049_g2.t2
MSGREDRDRKDRKSPDRDRRDKDRDRDCDGLRLVYLVGVVHTREDKDRDRRQPLTRHLCPAPAQKRLRVCLQEAVSLPRQEIPVSKEIAGVLRLLIASALQPYTGPSQPPSVELPRLFSRNRCSGHGHPCFPVPTPAKGGEATETGTFQSLEGLGGIGAAAHRGVAGSLAEALETQNQKFRTGERRRPDSAVPLLRSGVVKVRSSRKGVEPMGRASFGFDAWHTRRERIARAAEPGGSVRQAKKASQPDRQAALAMSMYGQKIIGADKTVPEVVPAELLEGEFGKELEAAMEAMVEVLHMLCLGTLILEDVKDKSTVGLYGYKLEENYVREETTMPAAAVTCYILKMLKEKFPEDVVISDQNPELLSNDEKFAETVASFLSSFDLIPEADAASASKWHGLCNSYPADAETAPDRYWVFNPVDTAAEFRDAKQFCSTLCLMKGGEPVISVVGCPMLSFDHPSRTTSHPSGSSIFYAVRGQGAWTQCVIMERQTGIYLGRYGLKGKSLKLDVSQKIKRGNDGLYDMLGTEQLRIAQHARMRQDIFLDSERIAKLLGSEFAKFHFVNNALKFCWLARGDEERSEAKSRERDVAWTITQGLYDKSASLKATEHAAGVLVAMESGAAVADLDGKDIDWSCGHLLSKNRGLFATDPKKVPKQGLINAVKEATDKSEVLYEDRCEKRKEKAAMLRKIFENLADHAETPEELKGAEMVRKKGIEMLDDEEEMMKLTQASMDRNEPSRMGAAPEPDPDALEGRALRQLSRSAPLRLRMGFRFQDPSQHGGWEVSNLKGYRETRLGRMPLRVASVVSWHSYWAAFRVHVQKYDSEDKVIIDRQLLTRKLSTAVEKQRRGEARQLSSGRFHVTAHSRRQQAVDKRKRIKVVRKQADLLPAVVMKPVASPTLPRYTLIFLHGMGEVAMRYADRPHYFHDGSAALKVLIPTAPLREISCFDTWWSKVKSRDVKGGRWRLEKFNSWYDYISNRGGRKEDAIDIDSLHRTQESLHEIIAREAEELGGRTDRRKRRRWSRRVLPAWGDEEQSWDLSCFWLSGTCAVGGFWVRGDYSIGNSPQMTLAIFSNRRLHLRHLLPPSPSAGAARPSRRPEDGSYSPEPCLDVHSDTFQRRSTLPALVDALLKLHCDTNTQALMLARQLQLDFHEVKFAVEEYRGSAKLANGGMDLDSFRNFLLRVFDIKQISDHMLHDAYEECQAGTGPMNTRRFLSWYRDHMFSLQASPTGQPGDGIAFGLAKKYQCSCIDLDRVKAQFDNFDLDKSGVIEYNEFENMIQKLLHCPRKSDLPPHRMQRFWHEIDRDRNGISARNAAGVLLCEFTAWYLKYFAAAQESGPIEAFYASFMPDVQRAHSLEVLEAKVQDCRLHYLERRFTITLPRMSQEEAQKERTAKEKIILGGKSQGCVTALDAVLTYPKRLGGFIGLVGHLLSCTPIEENGPQIQTPLHFYHEVEDDIMQWHWVSKMERRLRSSNYNVRSFRGKDPEGNGHFVGGVEGAWIRKSLRMICEARSG